MAFCIVVELMSFCQSVENLPLFPAKKTNFLVWMGQGVFPQFICVTVTQTVTTTQTSLHLNVTIALSGWVKVHSQVLVV